MDRFRSLAEEAKVRHYLFVSFFSVCFLLFSFHQYSALTYTTMQSKWQSERDELLAALAEKDATVQSTQLQATQTSKENLTLREQLQRCLPHTPQPSSWFSRCGARMLLCESRVSLTSESEKQALSSQAEHIRSLELQVQEFAAHSSALLDQLDAADKVRSLL